jgi:uncharacterized membrane protein
MSILLAALLIGIIAGLRAMTAPAAVSWAAFLGWLPLGGTVLGFLGASVTPWILTALALVELVTDQLPATPSRKVPVQFGARLVAGAVSGAAIGLPSGQLLPGLIAGVVGAGLGTIGGSAARAGLAGRFGQDRPAALIEDAVAILGATLVVAVLL